MSNNEIIVLKNEKYEKINTKINKNYQNNVKFCNISNIFISSIIVLLIIMIIQYITILNLKKYKYNYFQKYQNYNHNMS